MRKDESNKLTDTYIKQIKTLLYSVRKKENALLQDIENQPNALISENPESTIQDLYERIGTPQEIAFDYYSQLNPESLIPSINKNKNLRRIAMIIAIAVIIVLLGLGWALYIDYKELQRSIPVEVEEYIFSPEE